MKKPLLEAVQFLKNFIAPQQLRCMVDGTRGEESGFFKDLIVNLADLIAKMPATYDQDGKGDAAIVTLHYFSPGGDWFITEKDKGSPDDAPEDKGKQHQAFGLADPFHDGGELGYISIQELIENNVSLDLHFAVKTLGKVKAERLTSAR